MCLSACVCQLVGYCCLPELCTCAWVKRWPSQPASVICVCVCAGLCRLIRHCCLPVLQVKSDQGSRQAPLPTHPVRSTQAAAVAGVHSLGCRLHPAPAAPTHLPCRCRYRHRSDRTNRRRRRLRRGGVSTAPTRAACAADALAGAGRGAPGHLPYPEYEHMWNAQCH